VPRLSERLRRAVPFGLATAKPRHYREMLRVVWENRDRLGYAWRILRHGVCDGCSLGPRGLRDDAMKGVHLCMTRLRLLRVNTMPALDPAILEDAETLRRLDGRALRERGRLPYPMRRRRGGRGFRRVSWDEALAAAGARMRAADPDRVAFYTTSRGLTNEVYYVVQKFARLLGTNHVDNAARLCHAASTVALKETVGVAATTNSYTDWMGADLVVLFGTDLPANQPVATKYLALARQRGAKFAVVNPYREPGLERYWVPSLFGSALFGTSFMDAHFSVNVGGDVAFANGVLKHLFALGAVDRAFIEAHTSGVEDLERALAAQSWEDLEAGAGASRAEMERFARLYAAARNAIFIWSMGLTQHRFGVENVKAVVNLALARGMIGRPNTGLVPIRGHSGVQGAAECGCAPNAFPGGIPVNEENARLFSEKWGARVPSAAGLSAPEMIDRAHEKGLEVFHMVGGNFLDTLPDPAYVREALERIPLRIHQDLFLNTAMLVEPADEVLLFPGRTRYEQPGGGTATSTERRIRFSPEVPGPRIGESRSEWEIFCDLASHALPPETAARMKWRDASALRAEMEEAIPLYTGIAALAREGDSVQYGGPRLLEGGNCPAMPGGRARFTPLVPPRRDLPPGAFVLATRRGKQFNSIVWEEADALTGTRRRDAIFLCEEDARDLGLREGDPIVVESETGSLRGVVRIAPVQPRTLQAYFPEANVLLPRRLDPASREPDYNAVVTVRR